MSDAASSPNILAVRFSSIGDVLLTTPLLRAIRRRYPSARLTVLTKPAYTSLLSYNPNVTRVITAEPKHSLVRLAAELREGGYSHLFDLHDSFRSRLLRALVPGNWTTYPKHRIARTMLIHRKRSWYRGWKPVAERYFAAARELGLSPDGGPPELFLAPDAEREAATWLDQRGSDRPFVAVAPGAAHETKRWPADHWRTLLCRINDSGFDAVIVGSREDQPVADTLAGHSHPRVVSAAGRFGLQGTGALLKRATALVSGDTGVMHMATAVGTPVVALFGPTVKAFGFFPYASNSRVVELDLPCRPCSSKGGPRCPLGHHRCMVEISPDSVYTTLSQCLS